ncbi:YcaC-related amidohydrolase [Campylobacter vicugnae]|uniref:YcaC-related amidohydrolase n=1 Tax=Campylobacter vicugnae TaxID=1660076 RepID=A0A1X9T3A5_9BACT|nr:isochorismatase family protein [Campylobacter sp. RM8964]ARR02985.1 YcaC-related amidohydrolase [Campylobacter sp. RM8964]
MNLVLVIDIQERLTPVMSDAEELVANSLKFLQIAKELGLRVIATEQYTKGLGETLKSLDSFIDEKFQKMKFSAYSAIKDELKGAQNIYIIGIEAHICVYQTALDLIKNGYNVTLIDECISSRDPKNKALAYANLKDVKVKPLEMVAFELLQTAHHPSFKTISKLIK